MPAVILNFSCAKDEEILEKQIEKSTIKEYKVVRVLITVIILNKLKDTAIFCDYKPIYLLPIVLNNYLPIIF